jgi:hypothetical protein
MSTNDTVGMQAGILVIGYDSRTASCTVRILSTSDGFEVVGAGSAAMPGHGVALAEAEPAAELPPLPALICAASVQHNFRAGRHPGRCKPGRGSCR